MASIPLSERLCQQCEKGQKDEKAKTLCYECHLFLCVKCSDYHQRLKSTKDHSLVELVQFRKKSASRNEVSTSNQKSSSYNEDELASDFVEHFILREDTVLYHGAQAALESTPNTSTPKQVDHRRLKATKCLEFSVKRREDKKEVWVNGILCFLDYVVVVDDNNKVLKLFDQKRICLSSTKLKYDTWGITFVHDSTFATCGGGEKVCLWRVRGRKIISEDVSYSVDHFAYAIKYNGTYYCVLHSDENAITILDRQGRQVRRIIMKEACGKRFEFGCDIHMDSDSNNIYVPCWNVNGVLCMTLEGKALWFTSLSGTACGITEIQSILCVATRNDACLHGISEDGEYVRKLLDKKDLDGKPNYLFYGQDGILYVSYIFDDGKHDIISEYTVHSTD